MTLYYCPKCGSEFSYSEKHDAMYCKKCNKWMERKCHDPKCIKCVTRPDKPGDMNG